MKKQDIQQMDTFPADSSSKLKQEKSSSRSSIPKKPEGGAPFTIRDLIFKMLLHDNVQNSTDFYKMLLKNEVVDVGTVSLDLFLAEEFRSKFGIHNDLTLLTTKTSTEGVERTIVLIEAQSSYSVSMPLRCLNYYSQLVQILFDKEDMKISQWKPNYRLPKPEFFVVHYNKVSDIPEETYISDLWDGDCEFLQCKVKNSYVWDDVLYTDNNEIQCFSSCMDLLRDTSWSYTYEDFARMTDATSKHEVQVKFNAFWAELLTKLQEDYEDTDLLQKLKEESNYESLLKGLRTMTYLEVLEEDNRKQAQALEEKDQALEEKDQALEAQAHALVKTISEFITDPIEIAKKANLPLDKVLKILEA